MKCYFCENHAYEKITATGKENRKRRQKTFAICPRCSSMSDDRMLEEKLCWDEDSFKIKKGN
jgi:hypothetical protein